MEVWEQKSLLELQIFSNIKLNELAFRSANTVFIEVYTYINLGFDYHFVSE